MGKVAVVTGASKGIGGITALAFGKAGYDVIINYKSDIDAANKLVQQIKSAGQRAMAVQADVFTEAGVKELFRAIRSEYPKIDVFINNAGNPSESKFGRYTYEDVQNSLAANFASTVLCTQEAVEIMDAGSILFTSSIYGLQFGGNPTLPLYSAGKAAMINYAQTMAEALSPDIRCNVVAPGTTKTPGWNGAADAYVERSLSMSLLKEWVDPHEVAEAFIFLAETPHITGQTIVIDSGWQKKIRGQTSSKF